MFGGYAYANEPYAGATNQDEAISVVPASPYSLNVGSASPTITVTCSDPDGGATTMSLVSGSIPAGMSFSQTLPYTAAVPFNVTITGTPTTAANYTAVLRNDDGEGNPQETTLVFNVAGAAGPPLVIGGGLLGIIYGSPLGLVHGGGRGRYGRF